MRFSEMMGSGADPPPKRSTSEPEDAIAEALAPYLDTRPREQEPAVNPDETALVPVVPVAVAAPVAPVAPSAPVAIDYTPLSDDLLPHRQTRGRS